MRVLVLYEDAEHPRYVAVPDSQLTGIALRILHRRKTLGWYRTEDESFHDFVRLLLEDEDGDMAWRVLVARSGKSGERIELHNLEVM
jgi:hypothetical protein